MTKQGKLNTELETSFSIHFNSFYYWILTNVFGFTVLLLADPSDLTLINWVISQYIYWQINSLKQAMNKLATYVHLTTDAFPPLWFFKCIKY